MEILIGTVMSLVVMLLMFLVRSMSARITYLEKHTMHKREVRELIEDKIGGVKDDVAEIKQRINELLDYLMNHK